MEVLYTAVATSTGEGRNGHVRSDDGMIDFALRRPKSMGGEGGHTNPEQLFAAGYSACYHNALLRVSREAGVEIGETSVTAEVDLGKGDDGFGIGVALTVRIPAVDQARAEALAARANEVCPYSKATRGNIPFSLTAIGG